MACDPHILACPCRMSYVVSSPTIAQLQKLHIILTEDDQVAKKHDIEQAKAVLGDFISHRPSPDQLVKQKIITGNSNAWRKRGMMR